MKSYAQLNQSVAIHAGHTAIMLGVLFGIIATSGSALAQSGPYDCSGVEGVALSHCRALNAAAARRATEQTGSPTGARNNCTDLTGAALSSCRDLNGEVVRTVPVE